MFTGLTLSAVSVTDSSYLHQYKSEMEIGLVNLWAGSGLIFHFLMGWVGLDPVSGGSDWVAKSWTM